MAKSDHNAKQKEFFDFVRAVQAADLPEAEKIARIFHQITQTYLTHGQQELELLRIMGDRENLIKEQIKLSTMEHARSVFDQCFQWATGRQISNAE